MTHDLYTSPSMSKCILSLLHLCMLTIRVVICLRGPLLRGPLKGPMMRDFPSLIGLHTSRDHLLIQDSSRLSVDISRILKRKATVRLTARRSDQVVPSR